MKLLDTVNKLELFQINKDIKACCVDMHTFKKMMVFYVHDRPVWAHKDFIRPSKKVDKRKK